MAHNHTASASSRQHQTASGRRTTGPVLALDDGVFELPGIGPLWVWVHTCPDQRCKCREALILASDESRDALLTRGLRVREAWQAGHGYVAAAAAIEGLTSFMLNIDAVTPADLHGQALAATDVEPRIAAIVDRLQGDVLDDIARLWVLGKGYPDQREVVLAAKTIEVSAWQPGDMVAYRDVFNWVRRDRYLFDGDPGVFEAFDGYCINPACDCGDVVVQFYQLATAGDPQPVGEVAVNLSGRIEFIPEPGHDATLDRLWAAYGKRHPAYLACLAQRNADMKCIGKKRESLHRPKIGRNEPCPCGSGKKYKRCCADAIPD